ncbi:DNA polymerase III subunit alpha [Staphylococcus microti]|uniref:DNA polymerase III subunit alpha n=1 Tax=Staphylococcus microti TaxID=569857 RepID=A0A0D6XNY9_9STAP|nr:DNA polymerase III subunit alpha [Staphylococcus microti]KIX89961.1 DNA polymerase III subunit alpha [Staphylococcus microti]PNZ82363.1 DNA polymerase III subunit alpha [Staphylococcus microti]SUM57380.1 DNA polymerase III subunit alpha [Staphylococcus microti]
MVAHLNIHTAYDLLNSTLTVKSAIQRAKEAGYTAIAMTDLNVMYGIPQFYDACQEADMKALLGMTIHVTDHLQQREAVVIAKNNAGLQRLFKLSTDIKVQHLTAVDIAELSSYVADTVVIFKNMHDDTIGWLRDLPDSTSVYLDETSTVYDAYLQVWARAAYYAYPEDKDAIKTLAAIRDNTKVNLMATQDDVAQHILDVTTLQNDSIPSELLSRTDDIAALCNAELQYHQALLPEFTTPNGESANEYLWQKLTTALTERGLTTMPYKERLQYEFDVITRMGYADYFLIVSDLIGYAKNNGILVGPGRGSSAGSLVSYLLNITTIDPLRYDLLFERFLNPERVTMPDIDIDFEDTQREKVIQYVQEKYGDYRVSGIITFGHLLAKAVARDVGRVLGFDEATMSEASKLISMSGKTTLEEAYTYEPFHTFVHRNHLHEKWYELCRQLEGLPRNTSTHAAGVIVNDRPLFESIPLTEGDTGLLTQWTMTEAERIGLLKIDFLGLKNLTIIHQILKQVARDLNVHIDIEQIPFDDKDVFAMLSRGETTGIFQLESQGVRDVLKRLQPEHFEDIVAVTSLYRPGPMDEIPTYITRRHDPQQVQYLHPDLAPILSRTYGVIIYQEQIMQIASQFAGFSYGEADILRRAMSKKSRSILESERQHFIDGAAKKGYAAELSGQIFDLILKFANYGFPRAHAVSYSKIAYIMSYLKVHYAPYFYANILTNVINNEEKTAHFIHEAKQHKLKIHAPNINKSQWRYVATSEGMYISLGAIKGVGYHSVQAILSERYENGPFKDFFDFCDRLPNRVRTRRLLEALIFAGALDCFGKNRATLLQSIDHIADTNSELDQSIIQDFATVKKDYNETDEMPDEQLSAYEKEYLGFYVSMHPIEKLFVQKQYLGVHRIHAKAVNQPILVTVERMRVIRTKSKGQQMAFVTFNDGQQTIEGVLFPSVYQQLSFKLETNQPFVIFGKFEWRQQQRQIIVNHIVPLQIFEQDKINGVQKIVIRNGLTRDIAQRFLNKTATHSGVPVLLFNEQTGQMTQAGWIENKQEMITNFIQLFEPNHIRLL